MGAVKRKQFAERRVDQVIRVKDEKTVFSADEFPICQDCSRISQRRRFADEMHIEAPISLLQKAFNQVRMARHVDQDGFDLMVGAKVEPNLEKGHAVDWGQTLRHAIG